MDLTNLKSYQRTIASVDLPLKHFVETGFWNPHAVEGWTENDIGDTFVRRAARQIAKELKRPFIQIYACMTIWGRRQVNDPSKPSWAQTERYKLDKPVFSHGYIQVPKRQYLAPIVAPLFLLPDRPVRYGDVGKDVLGWGHHTITLWQFRISNEEFWNEYYQFALNDHDCRKARRLTA